MKTREKIIDHIKNVGYGKKAMREICAFLIGKGIKSKDEKFIFKVGEKSFDEFYDWFISEGKYDKDDLLNIYFPNLEEAIDELLNSVKHNKESANPQIKYPSVKELIDAEIAKYKKADLDGYTYIVDAPYIACKTTTFSVDDIKIGNNTYKITLVQENEK